MVTIGNSQARNKASEMTLAEWQKIRVFTEKAKNTQEEFGAIDAWFAIFELMGAAEADLDRLSKPAMYQLLIDFNKDEIMPQYVRVYEFEGRKYEAYKEGEDFVFSARSSAVLDRIVKQGKDVTFEEIVASIFLDVTKTRETHYTVEHVQEKAADFSGMRADFALPYVAMYSKDVAEVLKMKIQNEPTAEME